MKPRKLSPDHISNIPSYVRIRIINTNKELIHIHKHSLYYLPITTPPYNSPLIPIKINRLTLLPSGLLIQLNIRIQLLLLLRNLISILISLSLRDLQRQHFASQFEDLILDLPILQSSLGRIIGGIVDCRVESIGFRIFSGFALRLQCIQVIGRY